MTPWATLGVLPSATPEALRAAYRARARDTHPDRGGDPDEFYKVTQAYEAARNVSAWLPEGKICANCGGFGVVGVKKGLKPRYPVICPECKGEGR